MLLSCMAELSRYDLERIVRMLILTTTRTERHVVALRMYHGLSITETARRLTLPEGRIEEISRELQQREANATSRHVAAIRLLENHNKTKGT
jgi:DNA-directed RNA polymerase specialized sigma24 family protein